jgi:hypothetical protein
MTGKMMCVLALAGLLVAAEALPASADGSYHTGVYAFAPLNDAPLRSGFVANIHPNGPTVYAHEQYVVNGAVPDAALDVQLSVYPDGSDCTGAVLFSATTATIVTNVAGNGTAYHVFTPADADGLRGSIVQGMWVLMDGATQMYATGCQTITLD